jgi:hypothetical protein
LRSTLAVQRFERAPGNFKLGGMAHGWLAWRNRPFLARLDPIDYAIG